ncbi:MAG: POT family proton-dependent oligopeptide transporter [Flammeovirgaceae bacterium]
MKIILFKEVFVTKHEKDKANQLNSNLLKLTNLLMANNLRNEQEDALANQKQLFGHPVGLYILFMTELWERFSYYGMRAILVLYMIGAVTGENPGLGWDKGDALALYGWYTMLVYVMSIPGGIIADKFIGQKRAVFIGGLILVAGHTVLAFDQPWAFYTGLLLIVLGVGGLKPNISTMVGGLYKKGDARRDAGFTIFYIGINVGAFIAAIVVGAVGQKVGWHYGFGLAGIGMLLGQIFFMWGQKYLKGIGEPPSKKSTVNIDEDSTTSLGDIFKNLIASPFQLIITVLLIGIGNYLAFSYAHGWEVYAYALLSTFLGLVVGMLMMVYKEINPIEKDRFIVLIISFLIVIVFWGAFEQAGGLMNIYTEEKIDKVVSIYLLDFLFIGAGSFLLLKGITNYRKKVDTYIVFLPLSIIVFAFYGLLRIYEFTPSYEIPASVFQSVNALFIMIFGTVVGGYWISRQVKGKESSSIFKMAVGTIIMGSGFILMAAAAKQSEGGEMAGLYWLIGAYLLHTIGELCASPVALSFITKLAPVRYGSLMMGVYFAATGLGNKVAGLVGEGSENAGEFETFTGIFIFCTIFAVLLLLLLKPLKRLTHGAEEND